MQNVAHAELGGRKANLVTDYRLGSVKVKTMDVQACSLFYLFCSQERERKLLPLFPFHCNITI